MRPIAPTLLSLAPLRTLFARGLRRMTDPRLRIRMEEIEQAFTEGYHAALEERGTAAIGERLARVKPERQGFAAEGIGMGLALLDGLTPGRRDRLRRFVAGPGGRQAYMLHVGAGWALAFPLVSASSLLGRLDPLLGLMSLDGYGFYRAYFFWRRTVVEGRAPSWISGAARRSFDVGVGRRIWFMDTDTPDILRLAAAFPEDRRGDLWAGLGEACSFGGGRDATAVEALCRAAGPFLPAFAQGVAFSAEVRDRGGIPASHTEAACQIVWKRNAAATAAITREAAAGTQAEGEAALEAWRRRVRERFAVESAKPL